MNKWEGYSWLDLAIAKDPRKLVFTGTPQTLTQVWMEARYVGNIGIVRLSDMKIIFKRGI